MNDFDIMPRLARKLKAIRVGKNLTLQALSDKAKVSKGLLSKIENSRTVPSLPVFLAILHSLDLPLREFFEGIELSSSQAFLHVKRNQQQSIEKEEREGFEYRLILGESVSVSGLEAVLLTVQPGARSRLTVTDGYEIKYILSGRCDYFIGETKIQLEAGDTLFFDASKPHMPVNRGTEPVVMFVLYLFSIR